MTKERYMSLLNISSCLTREFVAIGRRMSRLAEADVVEADGFLGGILTGSDFCDGIGSMFLDNGPAFGAL